MVPLSRMVPRVQRERYSNVRERLSPCATCPTTLDAQANPVKAGNATNKRTFAGSPQAGSIAHDKRRSGVE
jgi:hypothetical protein